MPTINWEAGDHDAAQSETGVVHDSIGDHPGDGVITRGYEYGSLIRGLMGYYTFDSDPPDGSTAIDSAQFNHAYINGATHVTDSVIGGTSLDLDGVDNWIDTRGNSWGLSDDHPFTYSLWVNLDSTDAELVGNSGERRNMIIQSDGTIALHGYDGSNTNVAIGGSIPTGSWEHIAIVYDGGTAVAYHNGDRVGSASFGYINGDYTDGIGVRSRGSSLSKNPDGRVDDVRVYNRVLSTPEVEALSNLAAPSGYVVDEDPREGLVSHWALDGDATDSEGSNDGTVNGATFVDGFYGQAGSFNGTDTVITVPNNSNLNPGQITISFWANWSSFGGGTSIRKSGQYSTFEDSSGETYSNEFQFTFTGGGNNYPVHMDWSSMNTGEWYHIVGVYDGDRCIAYRNKEKVPDENTDPSGTLDSTTNDLEIGADTGNSRYFDGELDDMRIYDRELTPLEVEQLYEYGKRKIPVEANL